MMSRIKTAYNETNYKNYRNGLHKLLKNAERNYYNDQILTNRNNIRKSWSIIKIIINKNKGDQSKQTKFMLSDGSVTDAKQAVGQVWYVIVFPPSKWHFIVCFPVLNVYGNKIELFKKLSYCICLGNKNKSVLLMLFIIQWGLPSEVKL